MENIEAIPIYDLDLISGMYTELIRNHDIEKHSHNFFEIAITLVGDYVNHFDSGDLPLGENSMVIIRPHDIHYISNLKAIYRDIYITEKKMIQLCAAISPTLYDEVCSSKTPPTIRLGKDVVDSCESTANLITELRGDNSVERIEPLCNILILKALSAYYEAENLLYPARMPQWLLDFVAKLNVNAVDGLAQNSDNFLTAIVEESGYSHGHVCREFKKYYNCTPIQYLNKQKMIYSTTLLLNTKQSIAEIAQHLGYSNQSSYVVTFKSIYGVSPDKWRKNRIKRV